MTIINRPYDGGALAISQVRDAESALSRAQNLAVPEMVRVWSASAVSLGLVGGRLERCGQTRCLNLMLTYSDGCPAACAYCGEARRGGEQPRLSSRSQEEWPMAPLARVLDQVEAEGEALRFLRMCIATTAHPRGLADARNLVEAWTRRLPGMPVSLLLNPGKVSADEMAELFDAGVDSLDIGLDVASPALFQALRGDGREGGPSWQGCWEAIELAAACFGPGRFGIHLVAGLGESERQLLDVVERVRALGGASRLFAFRPEPGSAMVGRPAVPRDQWRRLQLARYLIDYGEARAEAMGFDEEGRLVDYGVPKVRLNALINAGTAFRTSGCRGHFAEDISACDRPWMDSTAIDIASFPFQPGHKDRRRIRRQLGMEG